MGKDSPELTEVAAFLEAAEAAGPRDHALACLLALNGFSMAAVCEARVSDLGPGARTLAIALLEGGQRTPMPLAPRTAQAIDEYLATRELDEEPAPAPLLLDDGGRPLTQAAAVRIVRRVARDAGLGYRLGRRLG